MDIMKCDKCGRDNLTAKELAVHNKYFHGRSTDYPHSLGQQAQAMSSEVCPDCGGNMQYQEGCVTCLTCGFSKCG